MGKKIVVSVPSDEKNARGKFGPICPKCAGFGFTYSLLNGKKLECRDCMERGVVVDIVDLQRQVIELTRLVKMLYSELKKKGLTSIE